MQQCALRDDIDHDLECDQHGEEQHDGLCRQAQANPPQAVIPCRGSRPDSCPELLPDASYNHALIL
jgi:hypothetical protein